MRNLPQIAACIASLASLAPGQTPGGAVFDEAWRRVRDEFYDPDLHGVDWAGVRERLLPAAEQAKTPEALSGVINQALDELHASHTHHYHPGQAAYYELRDVFSRAEAAGEVTYVGIGIVTREIGGRVFVEDIYSGGPAARSGLLAGDEIVSVNGAPWRDLESLLGLDGVETALGVRREGPNAPTLTITVTPEVIQPHELFLESILASARLIDLDGARVAYVRVRSYASPEYHEAVMELAAGVLATADAMVLDIRGGWGGARPSYMSLANPVSPTMASRARGEEWRTFDDGWHKPLVLLIDGGSRSGKEMLAYAYKKHGLARLVGERTAGAVLAGHATVLSDESLLYVAVADVLVDGERLEGVGVEPHVAVARDLPYSAGRDPQLDAALAEAARMAREAQDQP